MRILFYLLLIGFVSFSARAREASFVAPGAEPVPAAAPAHPAAPPEPETAPAPGSVAADWDGTPPALITALLPLLNLPLNSPALNELAARLLLSPPPADASGMAALQINGLIALGDSHDAWKRAELAPTNALDDATLRHAAEAALVGPDADALCALLPDLIKAHDGPDWLKALVVCQLKANDITAAQTSLSQLAAAHVADDTFTDIATKNVIGGGKQLPRQLVPLTAPDLALLRLTDLPLRQEVYFKPDAVLIPALLATKSADDQPRLALAEREAKRGLIDSAALLAAYRDVAFTPDDLATNLATRETGPRLRALLIQAMTRDRTPATRLDEALRFLHSGEGADIAGVPAQAAASLIADIAPAAEYNRSTAEIARLYLLAGKPEAAQPWLKQARIAALGLGELVPQLQNAWPLIALEGQENAGDFESNLDKWTTAMMQATVAPANPHQNSYRPPNAPVILTPHETASAVALLLEANGQAIPDSIWLKLAGDPVTARQMLVEPLPVERMRAAAQARRQNETILYALLTANDAPPPLLVTLDIIRALRAVGLTADATRLAVETAAGLMLANEVKQ